MFKGFSNKEDVFFALDISPTAVRVVELTKDQNGWKYGKHGFASMDPNLVNDQDLILKAIKEAIANAGIKTKNVAISLPNEVCVVKIAQVKRMTKKELAKAIAKQIKQLESRQGKQNYNYHKIDKIDNDNRMDVLVASSSREYINNFVDMLRAIDLEVITAEPESLALIRSTVKDDNPQLIINLKDFSTDFILSKNKIPYMVKTVQSGAGLFVGMLQQNLNLDVATAQKYFADYGLNPSIMNGQIAIPLEPIINQFINEVIGLINKFKEKYPELEVEKIVLMGYGAIIPHFVETIAKRTSITVEPADLWNGITISDKSKSELSAVSPHLAVTVGLAKKDSVL